MQNLLSLQQSYKGLITKDMEKINLALVSETDLKDLECMLQDIDASMTILHVVVVESLRTPLNGK